MDREIDLEKDKEAISQVSESVAAKRKIPSILMGPEDSSTAYAIAALEAKRRARRGW